MIEIINWKRLKVTDCFALVEFNLINMKQFGISFGFGK